MDNSQAQKNPDLLYSLACLYLASELTIYYAVDEQFSYETRDHARTWLSEAETVTEWLHEEKYRNQALDDFSLDTEKLMGSFLERETQLLKTSSKHAALTYSRLDEYQWFSLLYIKSYLSILQAFSELVQNYPAINTTFNYQAYKNNIDIFVALSHKLQNENPYSDALEGSKAKQFLELTSQEISDLWLNTVNQTYQTALAQH